MVEVVVGNKWKKSQSRATSGVRFAISFRGMLSAAWRGRDLKNKEVEPIPTGFKSEQSYRRAMAGNRIAIFFGVAFLAVCLGSYPTYHVLAVDDEHALPCLLASVAHYYYLRVGGCLIFGTALAIIAFFFGLGEERTFLSGKARWWHVALVYSPLLIAVVSFFIATVLMADFIGHSSQPALMAMKGAYDGYLCPALTSSPK